MCWLVRHERDEIRRVKNKTFLGHKIWYRDICYVGCAKNPPVLWREDSGPIYSVWLRQNKVSVRTAREIPQEKDFLWQVYWPWLTKNARDTRFKKFEKTLLQCPHLQSAYTNPASHNFAKPKGMADYAVLWVWVSQFFAQYVKLFCGVHVSSSVSHGATQTPCPHMFRSSL